MASCHPTTILRAIQRGELPAVRLGCHGDHRDLVIDMPDGTRRFTDESTVRPQARRPRACRPRTDGMSAAVCGSRPARGSPLLKPTLSAAGVFAVTVALADPPSPSVNKEFDLVPSCEFSIALSRLSLRPVRRACSRASFCLDVPAVVAREHVDVPLGHRLDGAAARGGWKKIVAPLPRRMR